MSTDTPEKYLIKEIGEAAEMLHWSHLTLQENVENLLISKARILCPFSFQAEVGN